MDEARAEIEFAYPLNLEIGDLIFVYSVRKARKLAIPIEDILITTGAAGDKRYTITGTLQDEHYSFTYEHEFKLAVLRH